MANPKDSVVPFEALLASPAGVRPDQEPRFVQPGPADAPGRLLFSRLLCNSHLEPGWGSLLDVRTALGGEGCRIRLLRPME